MEIVFIIIVFAMMWLMLIRPRQKQMKAHQIFLTSLQIDDRIITNAGIYGTIVGLEDDKVTVEVAPDICLTIARLAIQSRLPEGDSGSSAQDEEENSDSENSNAQEIR